MIIERYQAANQAVWDAFVRTSRNGTFLLERGYMDYHADRFPDHSLLVRDSDGDLLAVLPGHSRDETYCSHQGLSYGGLILGEAMRTPLMLGVLEAVAAYLREAGFARWLYKTIPHIYHRLPAEEDRYALFLAGAELSRRDVLAVLAREDRPAYQERRDRAVRKARKQGFVLLEDPDLAGYWSVVEENLRQRHDARPVHSLAEIRLLQERFPTNIRLFTTRSGTGGLLAGTLIYESARVAHVQYIASTEEGRKQGAVDLLFDELLRGPFAEKTWFDFGISNEDGGRLLNRGLIEQKEGFGGRAVVHDHYTIDLAGWQTGRLTGAMR